MTEPVSKKRKIVPPRCFKHDVAWQSRVQEILNKLRDKYIKTIHLNRINKLLRTCERLDNANPWEDVTDEQLNQSVKALDDYISSNTNGGLRKVLVTVMERLRRDGEIYAVGHDEPCPVPFPWSSALKLCYLLQKIVEKDYKLFEHKSSKPVQQATTSKKEEMSLPIVLTDIAPSFIRHIIGEKGQTIMRFMKREKCRVELRRNGDEVQAHITKSIRPENSAKLEEIGENLQKFVKEIHE